MHDQQLFGHILLICLIGCGIFSESDARAAESRTVGGTATHISKFPYVVSVRRKDCALCAYYHYCGGTIYKANIIITAASCVRDAAVLWTHVVAGTSYRLGAARDGRLFTISHITTHENERIDLALLHLDVPIGLNNFKMAAVTLAAVTPQAGQQAVVAGWGKTDELRGLLSEELHEVIVPIIDLSECRKFYFWLDVADTELCAGYALAGGSDACQGDGGGPLVVAHQMVGIVSWGYGCGRPNNPGVYTNVVALREWIAEHAK